MNTLKYRQIERIDIMARKYENVGNVKRLTQEEITKLPEGKRKYFNITYTYFWDLIICKGV